MLKGVQHAIMPLQACAFPDRYHAHRGSAILIFRTSWWRIHDHAAPIPRAHLYMCAFAGVAFAGIASSRSLWPLRDQSFLLLPGLVIRQLA